MTRKIGQPDLKKTLENWQVHSSKDLDKASALDDEEFREYLIKNSRSRSNLVVIKRLVALSTVCMSNFTHLGIDWGTRYLGIAYGDSETGLIMSYHHKVDPDNFYLVFEELLSSYEITDVVVGYPTNIVGGDTIVSTHITAFVSQLQDSYPTLNITLVNERYTTKDARAKLPHETPREILNNQSAAEILHTYFATKFN
jgi:putative transcription antitermination factor YqgF